MIVRVYAPGGCVSVKVNGVPAAGIAGDGEPSAGERTGAAYRRWRRRLQQRLVAACVNISTNTHWQTDYTATFLVPYEAGEIRATVVHPPPTAVPTMVGVAATGALAPPAPMSVAFRTAGAPVSLRLSVDRNALRPSRDDLAYVRAEVIDAMGVMVHCGVTPADGVRRGSLAPRMAPHRLAVEGGPPQRWADHEALGDTSGGVHGAAEASTPLVASVPSWCAPVLVSFAVHGAGELAAVGSGDPTDLGSFAGPTRKTYRGRAYAVVRPGYTGGDGHVESDGMITVTAASAGLKGASITLSVRDATPPK